MMIEGRLVTAHPSLVNYCDVRVDTCSLVGERYSWLCDDAMGGGVLSARKGKIDGRDDNLFIDVDKDKEIIYMMCNLTYSRILSPNRIMSSSVQGSAKRWSVPRLVNFTVAYHFCLALPAVFTQPGDHGLAESCTYSAYIIADIG